MAEILDLNTAEERFTLAHRRAAEMLAHVVPLDTTATAGMPLSRGRISIAATLATNEHGPTITETAEHYRQTEHGYAVDRLMVRLTMREAGILVEEAEQIEQQRAYAADPRVWTGGIFEEVTDDRAEEASVEIYSNLDVVYETEHTRLVQQLTSQL